VGFHRSLHTSPTYQTQDLKKLCDSTHRFLCGLSDVFCFAHVRHKIRIHLWW